MHKLISILGLVVIVGAGYFVVAQYINVAHGQSDLIATNQGSVGVSADGAQVLALLNTLKGIKLDGKIFSDPNFLSLQDWSQSINPQEVGRPNPFLSVPGTAGAISSTTKVSLPRK